MRDLILSKRHNKGKLTINEVLSINRQGNIFVREFLPITTYNLQHRTKALAAQRGYKYVWTKLGSICDCKAHGFPVIIVLTEADVAKLD